MPAPKKRLGQHFLTDPRILARIADALEATRADTVVEIGAGAGGLTAALAARAGRVVAIEKDRALVPALRERLPQVEVVEGDALTIEWHSLGGGTGFLLAGNIPYNITSPLLEKALEPPRPRRIVFLVQREVAERLTAEPGTSGYGALTVGVQAQAAVQLLFRVPAGAFKPRPQVDSAVVRLTPLDQPAIPDERRRAFRRLVVGLFGFRRKQLVRGLREFTGWGPEAVATALARLEVAPTARPETLTVSQFVVLLGALVDAGWVGDLAL